MALVRDSASTLLRRAESNELHDDLVRQTRVRYDSGVSPAEIRSWQQSLPALLADVHEAGLGHVEVLLEHKLPYSPKRVDAILCGVHPDGRPSYVLIELKQWTNVTQRADGLVDVPQYRQPVLHPVDQVRGYCTYLTDFTPFLAAGRAGVYGIAYLHNAEAHGWNLSRYTVDARGRLYARDFCASDRRGFAQIGCIYTAQGFEYDWSGVILGQDFVRRDGAWVARREYSHDGAVKRAGPDEFPALVRNTYKVLLTRGMKATAVFSTDPQTQEFLEELCR